MHDLSLSPSGSQPIRNQIECIIREVTHDTNDDQTPEQILGLIDSIDGLEILVSIEQQFGIRIEDEDLNAELLENLDRITQYVEQKLSSGQGHASL